MSCNFCLIRYGGNVVFNRSCLFCLKSAIRSFAVFAVNIFLDLQRQSVERTVDYLIQNERTSDYGKVPMRLSHAETEPDIHLGIAAEAIMLLKRQFCYQNIVGLK